MNVEYFLVENFYEIDIKEKKVWSNQAPGTQVNNFS